MIMPSDTAVSGDQPFSTSLQFDPNSLSNISKQSGIEQRFSDGLLLKKSTRLEEKSNASGDQVFKVAGHKEATSPIIDMPEGED